MAGEMPARDTHECMALGQVQRIHPVRQRARRAAAQGFERVVHRHGLRVLHKNARLPGGARAFPHHVAAQPGLGNAVGVRSERAQLIELEARVGHPVVKALHELAARDHRQLIQGRTGVRAPGHQFPVQARVAQRRRQQLRQTHLLALRNALGGAPVGCHHIHRHAGQAQQVKNRAHGGVAPTVCASMTCWSVPRPMAVASACRSIQARITVDRPALAQYR